MPDSNQATTKKKSDLSLLKRVLKLATPYKKYFWFSAFLAIALSALGPVRPFLVQLAVDKYILENNAHGLVVISLIAIGVLFMEAFLRYYFIFLTNWLGQTVIKDLRIKVFNHFTKLRLRYFDQTPIGTATTRAVNDIETLNSVFTQGVMQILADMLLIIFVLIAMFSSNWRVALISLATFPFLILVTYYFKEGVKSAFQQVRTQVARLNAFLQERITGMRVVQIFNAEDAEYKKFDAINTEHRAANIKAVWHYSIFFPMVEIILAAAIALMVWSAAYGTLQGTATVGTIIAFILYLNMLYRPLRMLADKFNTLQMGIVAADRVFDVLDTEETVEDKGTRKADKLEGNISFEKVWFAYNEEDFVLKDVSFGIEKGQTLAIVGATGAGKTSIINILTRYYPIQKGDIKIDNASVSDYDLHSLRSKIGMVLQDVFLFSGSIKENITLRNEAITMEQVIDAAKVVGAHDFIMKLPGQYEYNVMERGSTLSLGQRQLISFIRALVFNPSILILDEATSSIDTESEMMIQYAIETLIADRTSLVIAHRLSTIKNADKILVLDKGEVKEEGTHDELLAKDGYYKNLHDMQLSKQEETTH